MILNKAFFSENRWYLFGVVLYLLGGITLSLNMEKGDDVLFFANNRTPLRNTIFIIITQSGEFVAYLIAILIFLFIGFRYAILAPLLGGVVSLLANGLKMIFRHPRPSVYFGRMGRLEDINALSEIHLNLGLSSFPSGHTFSAFAIMSFLAFIIPNRLLKMILLLWAISVGISRVYLGQHFTHDIVFGGFLGVCTAMVFYFLQKKYIKSDSHLWYNKSILNLRKPTS